MNEHNALVVFQNKKINDVIFKGREFGSFLNQAESNSFVLSPQSWVKKRVIVIIESLI